VNACGGAVDAHPSGTRRQRWIFAGKLSLRLLYQLPYRGSCLTPLLLNSLGHPAVSLFMVLIKPIFAMLIYTVTISASRLASTVIPKLVISAHLVGVNALSELVSFV
jgi:hypothetical protein